MRIYKTKNKCLENIEVCFKQLVVKIKKPC